MTTHPSYFDRYINLITEADLSVAFANQNSIISTFLNNISEEKSDYAYAEGKWTIKEVVQHMIDAERVFCYRALCIARKETISLPGFDENVYAANSNANNRHWQSLVEELIAVRKSTELLFSSFNENTLSYIGSANNNTISVASLGFIILGHFYHHKKVIEERYY